MKYVEMFKVYFKSPSAEKLALDELEESRRELLKAQTAQEYHTKMVEFHSGKIKRLQSFLKSAMKEQESAS